MSLFGNRLELGDRLEVFDTPRCAFDLNETLEREAAALDAEHGDNHRVGQKLIVPAAVRDFAQEIDVTGGRDKREVQAVRDRLGVPPERQAGGSAAQVGLQRREGFDQTLDVLGCSRVEYIDIVRRAGRSMDRRRETTDEDEVRAGQRAEQRGEIRPASVSDSRESAYGRRPSCTPQSPGRARAIRPRRIENRRVPSVHSIIVSRGRAVADCQWRGARQTSEKV